LYSFFYLYSCFQLNSAVQASANDGNGSIRLMQTWTIQPPQDADMNMQPQAGSSVEAGHTMVVSVRAQTVHTDGGNGTMATTMGENTTVTRNGREHMESHVGKQEGVGPKGFPSLYLLCLTRNSDTPACISEYVQLSPGVIF
jgi:hypothetical protein